MQHSTHNLFAKVFIGAAALPMQHNLLCQMSSAVPQSHLALQEARLSKCLTETADPMNAFVRCDTYISCIVKA